MHVEIRMIYDPRDPEETGKLADTLFALMSKLKASGEDQVEVVSPVPTPPTTAIPHVPKAAPTPPKARATTAPKPKAPPVDVPQIDPDPMPGHGEPFDDDDEAPGQDDASRDDELTLDEQRTAALSNLRQVYSRPGGNEAVKKLQKLMKLTRFADVASDDIGTLYNHARALAKKFNVSAPAT